MADFEKTSHYKPSILCVEDDQDTCEIITLLFPDYEVVFAGTIEEAEDQLRSRKFILIILDNWLPDGSGLELCRKIRRSNSTVPIVFASGVGYKADIQKALDAGAQKYLVKPYEPYHLQKIVKELIENQ